MCAWIYLAGKSCKYGTAGVGPRRKSPKRQYVCNPDIALNATVRRIYGTIQKIFIRADGPPAQGEDSIMIKYQMKIQKLWIGFLKGPIKKGGGPKVKRNSNNKKKEKG